MATSSFSKEFIIEKPEAVEQFIEALNNPVVIKVKQLSRERGVGQNQIIAQAIELLKAQPK